MPIGQTGKIILGGAGGVGIPLGAEYLLQGARVNIMGWSTKWSGLIGLIEGAGGLLVGSGKVMKNTSADNKLAAAALGGAGAATGVAIIALEELRKRAQYQFQQEEATRMQRELSRTGGRVSLNVTPSRQYERQENPISPMVQEV